MNFSINQQMVELYVLGVLPESAKRRVEDAFDSNPRVQEWFLELDELPDHLEHAEEMEAITDQALAYRFETSDAPDREPNVISAPSRSVNKPEIDDPGTTAIRAPWSGERRVMDFPLVMAAAAKGQRTYEAASTRTDRFGQDGDNLYIRCDIADIPTGLCRLVIEESDGVVTNYYPKLTRVGAGKAGRWVFRASLQDILGRRPSSRKVTVAVVPATAASAHEFDNEIVRRIVAGWPKDAEQTKRAEEFLETHGTHHE